MLILVYLGLEELTSWQIDGEKMETVSDFIFLGPEITVDGDCSHDVQRLAPLRKSYDRPTQHINKESSLWQQRSI